MSVSLFLPWPPSVNTYWRSYKGRQILSAKARDYQKTCRADIMAQGAAGLRLSGSLVVGLALYPPDKRKRDIDNSIKAVLDQLVRNAVIVDDELVDRLVVQRFEIRRFGEVEVTVGRWEK